MENSQIYFFFLLIKAPFPISLFSILRVYSYQCLHFLWTNMQEFYTCWYVDLCKYPDKLVAMPYMHIIKFKGLELHPCVKNENLLMINFRWIIVHNMKCFINFMCKMCLWKTFYILKECLLDDSSPKNFNIESYWKMKCLPLWNLMIYFSFAGVIARYRL